MTYHFGRGWSRSIPYLLLAPGILLYIIIALGPSLATMVYSFTDATLPGAPVHFLGLENYREFLFMGRASLDNLWILWHTLVFCFFVTTIQFTFGLFIAVIINQKLVGRNGFRTLYFMPVILGAVIQGLIWRLFLYPVTGPLAKFLEVFGLHNLLFLGGQATEAFGWVITVQIWANVGTTMIIFLSGLQTIPTEMYEAAKIDGASTWQVFSNVTWPLLTPSVNTNLTLNIIGSLQAWQLFLVLLGYKQGTQVLGYLIYATGFGTSGGVSASFRQGYAAAASIVLFLLVLLIGMVVQYVLRRREARIMG
jgi:raffinose/stachyose/melibiose transport system permease protein